MHAPGSHGFGESVVGIVLMMWEVFQPASHQAWGDGLGPDVHETQLTQLVVLQLDVASVESIEDVLHPRNQQPDDRDLLVGDGLKYPFRFGASQEHPSTAREQATEVVHLAARVVERRDAQEVVITVLPMMGLLDDRRRHDAPMVVQYGLGEARSA